MNSAGADVYADPYASDRILPLLKSPSDDHPKTFNVIVHVSYLAPTTLSTNLALLVR